MYPTVKVKPFTEVTLPSGSSRGSSVKVQVLLPAPPKALKTLRFRGFSLLKIVGRHVTTAHKLMLRVCLYFSYLSKRQGPIL